jgi:uncharacterized protein (UPF0261 family)
MAKTVLVVGTFDTKEKEIAYLCERIRSANLEIVLMDVSCKEKSTEIPVDISCESVAKEADNNFAEVGQLDKRSAVRIMSEGSAKIAQKMLREGTFEGVIALGGANGTEIASYTMRQLPIGFPKVMVSCVASGNVRPYVGTKDIVMINSIGDISLNRITKRIINNAVLALSGMVSKSEEMADESQPQICLSTFGLTLPCVERARRLLHDRGFEVIELHASGGGLALEELVRSGEIGGVLDITTSELVDELVGGIYTAGPNRLEAAGTMGIPQVISVGGLDFANFGPKETIPEQYRNRHFYFYAPSITLMRSNVVENRLLGEIVANKLNQSTGPAVVLLPLRGFSSLDREGGGYRKTAMNGTITGEWYDQEANFTLIQSLKQHLNRSKVSLKEMDVHINDPEFAEVAVKFLEEMMERGGGKRA